MYLNTAGMRANERIRLGQKMKVDPNSTVNREMFENLRTADSTADLVGIQARFADDIQGVATKSPEAMPTTDLNTCLEEELTITATNALKIPLKNDRIDPTAPPTPDPPPPIPPNPKATIAAYIASQLFLASLKVEDQLEEAGLLEDSRGDDSDCPDGSTTTGAGQNKFIPALKQYYENDRISAENLVNLGLPEDKNIATAGGDC
jgi:hypothetical protein